MESLQSVQKEKDVADLEAIHPITRSGPRYSVFGIYTAYFDVTTGLPIPFGDIYGFNDLQIGLSYIPYGSGCVVASFLCGKLIDINYKRMAKINNITIDRKRGDDLKDFPIEKARVQTMYPLLALGIAALVAYGWVLQVEAPLAVPLVLHSSSVSAWSVATT